MLTTSRLPLSLLFLLRSKTRSRSLHTPKVSSSSASLASKPRLDKFKEEAAFTTSRYVFSYFFFTNAASFNMGSNKGGQTPDTDRVTGDEVQVRAVEGGMDYYGTEPFVKVQSSSS